MKAENKVQLLWGLILLFGGPLTQYITVSDLPALYGFLLWLVLAGAGFFGSFRILSSPKRKQNLKMVDVWKFLGGLGLIAALGIMSGLMRAHPSYIIVSWLILIGIGCIIGQIFENNWRGHVGTILLISAIFLIVIPDLLGHVFLFVALTCGIPLIIISLIEKA